MRFKAKQLGFLTPRSVFIAVVLLAMLLIPLWWLSRSSNRASSQAAHEKTLGASTPTVVAMAPAETNNPDAFGMTWGVMASDKLPSSAVWMNCHGEPREGLIQPHADSCNPYKGDTSCRMALPVLCIQKDGSASEVPPDTIDNGSAAVNTRGWAAGSVASTEPVAGFVVGSLAGANARCEKELGAGWQMASFHDGQGGWGFVAKRGSRLDTRLRHWVHINDQPGNCWNNKP